MAWKIWYGDKTSFSDQDGDIKDAPPLNVQLIVQENEKTGRFNQSGADYYIWRDGRWWGADIFGLFDFLMESGVVKFGRTITSNDFREIWEMSEQDTDFPRRSAFMPRERKP